MTCEVTMHFSQDDRPVELMSAVLVEYMHYALFGIR